MSFTQREARRIIRKAVGRVPEGESIRHLNITPMMDMMTILLVAFVFQVSTSALDLEAATISLPKTESDAPVTGKPRTLVITPTAIVCEGIPIVSVSNGDVDASQKEGGSLGIKIPQLSTYLAKLHQLDEEQQRTAGVAAAKLADPELLILADRSTPYRLLIEVMFSAKTKEAGYKHFRLVVQKNFPPEPLPH